MKIAQQEIFICFPFFDEALPLSVHKTSRGNQKSAPIPPLYSFLKKSYPSRGPIKHR